MEAHIGGGCAPREGAAREEEEGISPCSKHLEAFQYSATLQALFRVASQSANIHLPPHFIIPGLGRWMYIYYPMKETDALLKILSFARLLLPSLSTTSDPIIETVSEMHSSAAIGVSKSLR